jgi:hypothetical protein
MALRSGLTVSFTPIGLRKLNLIRTKGMERDLKKYTKEFADDVIKQLKDYPPPPGGSFSGQRRRSRTGSKYKLRGEGRFGGEYVRTYDLKRAWQRNPSFTGGRIGYTISNYVRDRKRHRYYARLVHGGPDGSGQWWYHASTGWLRIDEAVNEIGGRAGFREGAQFIVEDHIG